MNFYTTRDHLGSIRELTDSTGAIRARYDYDPYGRTTKLSGDLDADFRFQGMYYHAASGEYLTKYRIYQPDLARWTQPDPAGEAGGINLFQFVGNNPINSVDPLGLWQFSFGAAYGYGFNISFGYNSGQWNASGTVGIGIGLAASVNPNDNVVGHLKGPAAWGGIKAQLNVGSDELLSGSPSLSVTGEGSVRNSGCNHNNNYWAGTTVEGDLGNMYLGGVSGSAWAGVTGNTSQGTIAPSIDAESAGWSYSGGALVLAGVTAGYHD